jgi:chromosome segregation ATPase
MPAILKRPAAASSVAAAKKAKVAARQTTALAKAEKAPRRDPSVAKVSAGLDLAQDLPEAARNMLSEMLDFSLATFKEDRHRYQASMVEVVEKTLGEVTSALEVSLKTAQSGINENEARKEACTSSVEELETKAAEQRGEVGKMKYELADVARAFKAARQAVDEAETGQEMAERELKKAIADKDQLEDVLANHLRPLLLGGGAAGDATVQEKVGSLTSTLKKFGLDESMMSALPTALLKEPSARGPFDTMVLTQVDKDVSKRIAAYDATLKEAEPARAERVAKLERAEAELARAKTAQLESARAFQEARQVEEKLVIDVGSAKQSVTEVGKDMRRLQKEAEKAARALESFHNGPWSAFCQLRDRTAPPPPPSTAEKEDGEALAETEAPLAVQEALTEAALDTEEIVGTTGESIEG